MTSRPDRQPSAWRAQGHRRPPPFADGAAVIADAPGPVIVVDVIAVSGFARQTDYQRTSEAGFDGHGSKPFDIATIVAALRRVVRDPTRGRP